MIDYSAILVTHFADQTWTLNGESYEGLTWISDTPKPSQEDLDTLWPETVAAIEAKADEAILQKQAILNRLGITADEARLLLL